MKVPWPLMIVMAVVAARCFYAGYETSESGTSHQNISEQAKRKMVFMLQSANAGERITAQMLEEREVEQNRIPQDAVSSASLALDHTAKYFIHEGAVLSQRAITRDAAAQVYRIELTPAQHAALSAAALHFENEPSSLASGWVRDELKARPH